MPKFTAAIDMRSDVPAVLKFIVDELREGRSLNEMDSGDGVVIRYRDDYPSRLEIEFEKISAVVGSRIIGLIAKVAEPQYFIEREAKPKPKRKRKLDSL